MAKAKVEKGNKKATKEKPAKAARTAPKGKSAQAKKANKKGGLGQYFREVRTEMKRVSWPNRAEVVSSTLLVLAVVLFFAVYVGLLDVIFIRLVKYLTFNF